MYTTYLTALLTLGASLSAASPLIQKRAALSSSCASRIGNMGVKLGANLQSAGSASMWVGSDGPYTSSFVNKSPHELCLVVWDSNAGYVSSFVGTAAPMITVAIPPHSHSEVTLSFANGASGAWSAIWPDTKMSQFGQIYDTWGEFTFSPMGVVDISREVNPNGHHMRIKGPSCSTTMNKCVFKCNDPTALTCGEAGTYSLLNCAQGSQPGAGMSSDAANGGCGWQGASSAHFLTTIH